MKKEGSAEDIRYSLEIDEEGFPMFEGRRWNDEEILSLVFKNMHRLKGLEKFAPLVTECEGQLSFVVGFSDPLVAQSVELLGNGAAQWNFLGGLSYRVELIELRQDPWHRIHAYVGPDSIPAVLSRKAQADFLAKLSIPKNFKIPVWRKKESSVEAANFWDAAFKNGEDGWEMGKESPVLKEHFKKNHSYLKPGARILVPGAGRGNDAKFFEDQGFKVDAVDFSAEAQSEFAKRHGESKINYICEDIFSLLKNKRATYDAIFEHTFYCAIDPELRAEYLNLVEKALKANGIFFGIHFIHSYQGGPPFGNTQWELREMTKDVFDYLEWELSPHSVPGRRSQELWAVMRKKN